MNLPQSSSEALQLARRLRELRRDRWPDMRITQPALAELLDVQATSVSSWESASNPKMPPASRLVVYARIFATRRTFEQPQPRLIPDDELDPAERAERERLDAELSGLREGAVGPPVQAATPVGPNSFWHFPDGGRVRMICGMLPPDGPYARPSYASATDPNYVGLSAYADLDALVELFGHIRAVNPGTDVGYEVASRLEDDDLTTHLVLIGGHAYNQATRLMTGQVALPIRADLDDKAEVFRTTGDEPRQEFGAAFAPGDGSDVLVEDVGLLVRAPNLLRTERTLTIVSGLHTRGVYGAVRCLTDPRMRRRNEGALARRFAGADSFGLLMRVPVLDHATPTPDLDNPRNVRLAWPIADGDAQ